MGRLRLECHIRVLGWREGKGGGWGAGWVFGSGEGEEGSGDGWRGRRREDGCCCLRVAF